jgi:hypothetical protein
MSITNNNFILTSQGYKELAEIGEKYVNIYTGKRWVQATFKISGRKSIWDYTLTNGNKIRSSPDHLVSDKHGIMTPISISKSLSSILIPEIDGVLPSGHEVSLIVEKLVSQHIVNYNILEWSLQYRTSAFWKVFLYSDNIFSPSVDFLHFIHILGLSCGLKTRIRECRCIDLTDKNNNIGTLAISSSEFLEEAIVYDCHMNFYENSFVCEGVIMAGKTKEVGN